MSEAASQLMPTLLALPPEARLELAALLNESVPVEIAPEFEAVLDRRRTEMESGQVKGIPADEVFRRLREKRS